MGASVRFRVGGWKCLRDVVVKFNKVFLLLSNLVNLLLYAWVSNVAYFSPYCIKLTAHNNV